MDIILRKNKTPSNKKTGIPICQSKYKNFFIEFDEPAPESADW